MYSQEGILQHYFPQGYYLKLQQRFYSIPLGDNVFLKYPLQTTDFSCLIPFKVKLKTSR